MMRTTIAAVTIAASLVLLGGTFALAIPALAQYSDTDSADTGTSSNMTMDGNASDTMNSDYMDHGMDMSWLNDTDKIFGVISSIQNDEDGEPAWITTGHWMMTNETEDESNETETADTNMTDFHAGFQMITLEGTDEHTHEIYNFTQDGESTTEDNVTTITGTSTVTMMEGPVEDVETEITISNGKVIAISLDPEAVENHFGDTPIYGIVITPELLQHIMNATSSMDHMKGMMGNETGMMDEDHEEHDKENGKEHDKENGNGDNETQNGNATDTENGNGDNETQNGNATDTENGNGDNETQNGNGNETGTAMTY
jgi:hypothetical protein